MVHWMTQPEPSWSLGDCSTDPFALYVTQAHANLLPAPGVPLAGH